MADLAQVLGGSLEISSQASAGTTFALAFDAQRAPAPSPDAAGQLRRALVVEDSPVYGLLLRQAFENQGVATVHVESVEQACEALTATAAGAGSTAPAFDLVLSDVNLDGGHVEDLVRFMRESSNPGVDMPPLICMSAEFDAGDRARLADLRAIDLLTKDSDVAAFAARVQHSFAAQRGV